MIHFHIPASRKKILTFISLATIIGGFQILGLYLTLRETNASYSLASLAKKGIIGILICAILLPLGWELGKKLMQHGSYECATSEKPILKIFSGIPFIMLIIILCWLPCFLAYFPGIYSYDGEPQLIQYINHRFDNHHPVIHTLLLGSCYDLGKWFTAHGISIDGLAFYSVIQMLLLSGAFAYVIRLMIKKQVNRVYLFLNLAYFCLFPVNPMMAVSSTKDTVFAAFFVMFLTELSLAVSDNTSLKASSLVRLFIFAAGCMFFRRNGLYVILLLSIGMAMVVAVSAIKKRFSSKHSDLKNIGSKRPLLVITATLLLSVVFFTATEKLVMRSLHAVQGESAEALSIPLQQMARAYKSNEQQVRDTFGDRLFAYISPTGLANYRPLITDGVKQGFNNDLFKTDKKDFVKLYIDMGFKYPGSYILSVLYLTKGDWQILDTSYIDVYHNWWRDRTGYLITDATPVFAQGYVKKENLLPKLRDDYEAWATDCSFLKYMPEQIVCSPASYVILSLLGSLALLIKKKQRCYPIAAAILIYLLTILAGPCVLVRYIYPIMVSMPLFAWLVLDSKA